MSENCTNSQRLRATIAIASGTLSERAHELWTHPRFGELYPEFLFAIYGMVVSSTPMLRQAALEADRLAASDALASQLAPYLHAHAKEEQGHEEWVLDDLSFLGFDRDRVFSRLPYTSVSALIGSQYYLARHVHPVAVLGYIAVVENPKSPEYLEDLAVRTGLPVESMSTLLRHSHLDKVHVADFDRMLDSLSLTPMQRDVMTASGIATVSYLEAFFADVLEHFGRSADRHLSKGIFHRAATPSLSAVSEVAGRSASG
jgi:heme oxygenase-like protein